MNVSGVPNIPPIRLPSEDDKKLVDLMKIIYDHRHLYASILDFKRYFEYYSRHNIPYITPPAKKTIKKYLNSIQETINDMMQPLTSEMENNRKIQWWRRLIKKEIIEIIMISILVLEKPIIDDTLYKDCIPLDKKWSWGDFKPFEGVYLDLY